MKSIFLLTIMVVTIQISKAQFIATPKVTPMHKFFQQYADSTVIIEYQNEGNEPTKYRLICKREGLINVFIYEPIDTSWKLVSKIKAYTPKELWQVLAAKKVLFQNTPADINIFFHPSKMGKEKADRAWKSIQKLSLWNLVDDSSFGPGCNGKTTGEALEGKPDIIHLITKNNIKTLVYEYPDVYEKRCPGNENRQKVIALNNLFRLAFEQFKDDDTR
ncbi:hypothetical protein [Pedobacter sp.]|uniref:hypothetical protein n=1 Tax=Pedobacter sp. TaxID=1411316 RepID=UPI003BABA1ED